MKARNLWDTEFPEEMVLMARDVSEHKQVDFEVDKGLLAELNHALEICGAEQLSDIRRTQYVDPHNHQHTLDYSVVIKTKGGWHE